MIKVPLPFALAHAVDTLQVAGLALLQAYRHRPSPTLAIALLHTAVALRETTQLQGQP